MKRITLTGVLTGIGHSGLLLLALALGAGECGAQEKNSEKPSRPNIIFLFADDQRADTIGAHGNPHIRTPNLDRLAAEGFSFRRNYCAGSFSGAVCVASRAMLMTGRHWMKLPANRPASNWGDSVVLPALLTSKGDYQSFIIGKWHNGRGTLDRSFPNGRAIYMGGMANHADFHVQDLVDGKLAPKRNAGGFSSKVFADEAVTFLRTAGAGQPFFLYVAFMAPHDPRNPPETYRRMYYSNRPPLPANFLPQHPFRNAPQVTMGRDESLAPWPRTRKTISDQLCEYYGLVTHLDDQVGRIMEALGQSPHAENTIVIYTADHGLAMGSHGLLGKQNIYDQSMRCPLILSGPGIPKGQSSNAFTHVHDLYATICDLAAVDSPPGIESQSLLPIVKGETRKHRESLFLPFQDNQRAIQDEKWKLHVYPKINHRLLFDLSTDPHELTNLADDPAHRVEVERMQRLMEARRKKLGDPYPLSVSKPEPKEPRYDNSTRVLDVWQPRWIREKYFEGRETANHGARKGKKGSSEAETLPPLAEGKVPQSFLEMWSGFDPREEPLEIEILKEWEEDEVVLRVLRYRIGVFKGRKAMMAAIYGYPKGGRDLPGLVQIHGGGQYADHKAVLTNAKRGYATISIAWAGRISAPGYRVTPTEVKLFWDNRTEDPAYKITTDWGLLDAYHAPSRNGKDAFVTTGDGSASWTLDEVESPRNNSWFLCTLGARRALTFLERQPEVDGNRLGVYGHSMGGKLTVATAASDKRVKAAAPSCGGISDRYNTNPLHHATIGDSAALKHLDCPVIFLSPANDFHGHINTLVDATRELGETEWRVTCSAHLNHRDYPENEVATQLWFDQHLKEKFAWPETPETKLTLKTEDGIPHFSVRPDPSGKIVRVEVYYTQQGRIGKDHRLNRINQFWHYARCEKQEGAAWSAMLPVFSVEKPLWVYANVVYALDKPVSSAGYYYGAYTSNTYNLSSLVRLIDRGQLQEAGVRPTLTPTPLIESFKGEWRKDWFTFKPGDWSIRSHKVYHPLWAAPEGASLSLEVISEEPNKLVIGVDEYAAEIELQGSPEWQSVTVESSDLKSALGTPRKDWTGMMELRLLAEDRLRSGKRGDQTTRRVGATWKGAPPQFRNLRWAN